MPSALANTLSILRARGLKYTAASVISTALSQLLLFGFSRLLTATTSLERSTAWVMANIAAVTLSAVPSFYLNRMWVWGRGGRGVNVTREALPFWGFAVAGLLLSTVSVAVAARLTDATVVANIANLLAFGALWLVKLFVLDRHIFNADRA